MSSTQELAFARAIAALSLTQADQAVAFLWLKTHEDASAEATARELAEVLQTHALAGSINIPRLRSQLSHHLDTVAGVQNKDAFRIRLSRVQAYTERYGALVTAKPPEVKYSLIPEGTVRGTRRYLERLSYQLNGCYESEFYDGAAVLIRRLTETILIEAFEKRGHGVAIKSAGEYMSFGDLIGIAGSGACFKLVRGTARSLERIKAVGDTAAHHRTHITSKADIDDIAHEFRRVLSELLDLAELHPKP